MKLFIHWLGYCIQLCFFLFLFRFTQSYLLFLCVTILVLLPIISFLLTRYAVTHLRIEMVPPIGFHHKNQPIDLSVCIYNKCRIPLWRGILHYELYNSMHPTIKSDEKLYFGTGLLRQLVIHQPIESRYCGRIVFTLHGFETYDYLGLFHLKRSLSTDEFHTDYLLVPDTTDEPNIPATKAGIHGNEADGTSNQKGQDASEIVDYRKYIPGDRLQTIHWKLSLRQRELFVKEQADPSASFPILFLDLIAITEDLYDDLLELVASVSHTLICENQPFVLCWMGKSSQTYSTQTIYKEEDWINAFYLLTFCANYTEPRILSAYYGQNMIPDNVWYLNDWQQGGA